VETDGARQMARYVTAWPSLLEDGFAAGAAASVPLGPETRLTIVGVGGSAIGGELLADLSGAWEGPPIQLVRDARLPRLDRERDLVIAVSYSGETAETLAAAEAARRAGQTLIAIASGGALARLAERGHSPLIRAPADCGPPRMALGFLYGAMLGLSGLAGREGKCLVRAASQKLRGDLAAWRSSKAHGEPGRLAAWIGERLPIVYGTAPVGAVARRWRCEFNENAKRLAWDGRLPEAAHNEIVGWAEDPRRADAAVLLLRDPESEPAEVRALAEAFAAAFSKDHLETCAASGPDLLTRQLRLVLRGDLLSLDLARLSGVDPLPHEAITALKQRVRRRLQKGVGGTSG